MPFFNVGMGPEMLAEGEDPYIVERAVDIIRQATEIQSDPELMAKVTEELLAQKRTIDDALSEIPDLLEEDEEPVDETVELKGAEAKLAKFLKRMGVTGR